MHSIKLDVTQPLRRAIEYQCIFAVQVPGFIYVWNARVRLSIKVMRIMEEMEEMEGLRIDAKLVRCGPEASNLFLTKPPTITDP